MAGMKDGGLFPGVHSKPSLGFDFINAPTDSLKGALNNGERGSFKKAGAYLGYRLITYSCIPTLLNAIAALVAGVLTVLTFLFRGCAPGVNDRCLTQFQSSISRLADNIIFDLTCDFRQFTGALFCCCRDECWIQI